MNREEIKKTLQSGYAKVALQNVPCCGAGSGCCRGSDPAEEIGRKIGYSHEELAAVPEGANLGLGCGNPLAFVSLRKGDVVLDLGSGAGFDCFLAASRVGAQGKVIGVDMTPEMLEKARQNAKAGHFDNVEFRLGEIEKIPVDANEVDVVISNCVINLSPDKEQVFREAHRVLKPGGRLMVSDLVLLKELPEAVRRSAEAYVGCVAGAVMKEEYLGAVEKAGFREIQVLEENVFPVYLTVAENGAAEANAPLSLSETMAEDLSSSVASIKVSAVKSA